GVVGTHRPPRPGAIGPYYTGGQAESEDGRTPVAGPRRRSIPPPRSRPGAPRPMRMDRTAKAPRAPRSGEAVGWDDAGLFPDDFRPPHSLAPLAPWRFILLPSGGGAPGTGSPPQRPRRRARPGRSPVGWPE